MKELIWFFNIEALICLFRTLGRLILSGCEVPWARFRPNIIIFNRQISQYSYCRNLLTDSVWQKGATATCDKGLSESLAVCETMSLFQMFSCLRNINFSDRRKHIPSCILICSSNLHYTLFEKIAVIQASPRMRSLCSESVMNEALAPRVPLLFFIPGLSGI